MFLPFIICCLEEYTDLSNYDLGKTDTYDVQINSYKNHKPDKKHEISKSSSKKLLKHLEGDRQEKYLEDLLDVFDYNFSVDLKGNVSTFVKLPMYFSKGVARDELFGVFLGPKQYISNGFIVKLFKQKLYSGIYLDRKGTTLAKMRKGVKDVFLNNTGLGLGDLCFALTPNFEKIAEQDSTLLEKICDSCYFKGSVLGNANFSNNLPSFSLKSKYEYSNFNLTLVLNTPIYKDKDKIFKTSASAQCTWNGRIFNDCQNSFKYSLKFGVLDYFDLEIETNKKNIYNSKIEFSAKPSIKIDTKLFGNLVKSTVKIGVDFSCPNFNNFYKRTFIQLKNSLKYNNDKRNANFTLTISYNANRDVSCKFTTNNV